MYRRYIILINIAADDVDQRKLLTIAADYDALQWGIVVRIFRSDITQNIEMCVLSLDKFAELVNEVEYQIWVAVKNCWYVVASTKIVKPLKIGAKIISELSCLLLTDNPAKDLCKKIDLRSAWQLGN